VCRSSPLPSCVLQLAPLSPAQAATTTRGRPQLRPQDWIRSQTPGSPPVRRSRASAAAALRAVDQCRSSMVGSPGHQLADPDHQQWSPHNAQICAAGAEAASTRPPRRTAAMRAAVNTWLITLCEAVHRPGASRARRPGTPTNRQGLWMLGTERYDDVRQRVGAVCSAVVVPCAGGGQPLVEPDGVGIRRCSARSAAARPGRRRQGRR